MKSPCLAAALACLALSSCSPDELPETAQIDDAQKAIMYRQHNMRALSAAYRSLELIVRHGLAQEDHLQEHTAALMSAARRVEDNFAFPTHDSNQRSEARALIWQDDEGFTQHAHALLRKSEILSQSVDNLAVDRQALLDSLDAVRQQCLDCHDRYRRRP